VTEAYFLAMVLGLPALLLGVCMVAGLLYREGPEELLDWRPTRSLEKEAELAQGDVVQMLAALNRYRRARGVPEQTLEEATERVWGARVY
jgi:hypothetical protein